MFDVLGLDCVLTYTPQVDDSGSMAGALWRQAREALAGIARLAGTYDNDGIDIFFLNSPQAGRNLAVRRLTTEMATSNPPQTARDVKRLFNEVRPRGMFPIVFRRG